MQKLLQAMNHIRSHLKNTVEMASRKNVNFGIILGLLLVAFTLVGCYEVPYQVNSSQNAVVQDELIGSWVRNAQKWESRLGSATISRVSESPLYDFHYEDGSGKTWDLRALLNRFHNSIIASAFYRERPEKGFVIFRVTVNGDKLILETLDETAPRFTNSDEFRTFLESEESQRWFVRPMEFSRTQ
ncbi:MAG: hypothetical protein KDD60_04530 [Bdellovibrionales bacterium]|nr:hypothetical protein [Bdellovibrionales bacterium]